MIKNYIIGRALFSVVLIIGAVRAIQGLYNSQPVFYLVVEMLLFAVCFLLLHRSYSAEQVVNSTTRQHFNKVMQANEDWSKDVVKQYAVQGEYSLNNLTQAALLASVMVSFSSFANGHREEGGGCAGGGDRSGAGGGGCGGGGCGGGCGGG